MPKKQVSRPKSARRGKPRKSTAHDQWLRVLMKQGAYRQKDSDGAKQIVLIYRTTIPPRMPRPGGATPGATYTTSQLVKGADMTLPTGSALVGSLIRQNSATDVFVSWAFCLADVPNISSLTALYDQYRIEEIQFRLRTKNESVNLWNSASPNYASPDVFIVVDRDDNTAPTTILELQQYDNCQECSASDNVDIVFTPSITPSVFSGGVFSGYAVENASDYWLDCANASIPHFGVKAGLTALVTSTTQKFDWFVEAWYKVSFKNSR